MSIRESLLPEFDQETAATRTLLERVPEDKLDWRPHEKSMTLGRLATHIAELPEWTEAMIAHDSFDVAPPEGLDYSPVTLTSTLEILDRFDTSVAKARDLIARTGDDEFVEPWTLKKGGQEIFTAPRFVIIRRNMMNHLVHHRGQLTVFLRLNDVPLPQIYGPTADEPDM